MLFILSRFFKVFDMLCAGPRVLLSSFLVPETMAGPAKLAKKKRPLTKKPPRPPKKQCLIKLGLDLKPDR